MHAALPRQWHDTSALNKSRHAIHHQHVRRCPSTIPSRPWRPDSEVHPKVTRRDPASLVHLGPDLPREIRLCEAGQRLARRCFCAF